MLCISDVGFDALSFKIGEMQQFFSLFPFFLGLELHLCISVLCFFERFFDLLKLFFQLFILLLTLLYLKGEKLSILALNIDLGFLISHLITRVRFLLLPGLRLLALGLHKDFLLDLLLLLLVKRLENFKELGAEAFVVRHLVEVISLHLVDDLDEIFMYVRVELGRSQGFLGVQDLGFEYFGFLGACGENGLAQGQPRQLLVRSHVEHNVQKRNEVVSTRAFLAAHDVLGVEAGVAQDLAAVRVLNVGVLAV